MKIFVATSNDHKVEEIRRILEDFQIEIEKSPKKIFVEENGETFLENSVKKAYYYGNILGTPVVADDSGLVIDYLGGFPGVKSARFMENRPYKERMIEILRLMKMAEDRSAKFVCVASYYNPKTSFLISVEGVIEGEISYEVKGEKGFGYDPIFIPEGYKETFGELGQKVKDEISHRSRAFKKLFSIITKIGDILELGDDRK
ncbi:RdgB/HAM1 family non-canonical purine NTP pyrophosphatase [Thermosipho atlanticus]|uniref:dITP/XTP pyrophosphatase n=1 Tax=Thermosipho atlanticus DSM 15807 TaxID=1123380 RepID=A0A1M5RXT0_9BACT|nr:RdgB/HAM1 family non-canonical purine NTP pyrophosphatase [Thermosipho atlanticus]SHH31167.1 dITPase [Thermosipho atlanticus DSM 15807]